MRQRRETCDGDGAGDAGRKKQIWRRENEKGRK
jgi:hypothetical protein